MIHRKVYNNKTMNIQYMWRKFLRNIREYVLSISQMSYVGIKSPDNGYFSCYFGQIALCTIRHLENGGN